MRASAVSCSSSAVRSCITRLARGGSFQRLGSSACRFSSARRTRALSTSKMPPQQACGLLDLGDDVLDFGAHGKNSVLASRERRSLYRAAPAANQSPRLTKNHAQSQYSPPVPLLRIARSASGDTATGPASGMGLPLAVSVPTIE